MYRAYVGKYLLNQKFEPIFTLSAVILSKALQTARTRASMSAFVKAPDE